ncbi:AAA family ATPase [Dysgonomonas sp. HGC4]|uniref:AAA family ATPase n=1 Tax=Dysgonomonas sp. HGC4 TaxID=1658009 RepID=UPI00067FD186|nr:ATP-binding protein [Dysgonomonas sp. HGC4]MBD8346436.1 AAA family ATPase [Dysgonomonas sp. HGC4]
MAFKNIEIKHFRGINECQIEDLKQVNLFVGKNNCGKTSVLDAIFLLTSMSRPDSAIRTNFFRDFVTNNFQEVISVLFYNLNLNQDVQIQSEGTDDRVLFISPKFENPDKVEIEIADISQEPLVNQNEPKIKELTFRFETENNEYEASIAEDNKSKIKSKDRKKATLILVGKTPKEYNESIKSKYINTKSSLIFSSKTLASIIIGKDKQDIIEALQQIEPNIQNIEFSIDNKVMVDLGGYRLFPLEVLGDGIRRLLAIIISIYECENGILLIDEIDNGLHYSSMDTLWKMILSTAKKYNVQIFATSHNIDSLQALKNVLETKSFSEQQNSTVCYNLNRIKNDVLKSYQYNFDQFQYAIDMENEIR